jgi:hypothetical protein
MMVLGQIWRGITDPRPFPDLVVAIVVVGGLMEVSLFQPTPGVCSILFLITLYWRQVKSSCEGGDTTPIL